MLTWGWVVLVVRSVSKLILHHPEVRSEFGGGNFYGYVNIGRRREVENTFAYEKITHATFVRFQRT